MKDNSTFAIEMKKRTKAFGLRIIKLTESLPNNRTSNVISNQLLRCGTSIGANYRAACSAKSNTDFIAKMGIVDEEADESIYWIEMLIEAEIIKQRLVDNLLDEANQILAIIVTAINTARGKTR